MVFGLGKPNIEKMEKKKDVEGLIKALNHSDSFVQNDAARALGRVGDKRAVNPLIQNLNEYNTQYAASEALYNLEWEPTKDVAGATYWINMEKNCKELDKKCIEIGYISSIALKKSVQRTLEHSQEYFPGFVYCYTVILCKLCDLDGIELLLSFAKSHWSNMKSSLELLDVPISIIEKVDLYKGYGYNAVELHHDFAEVYKNDKR